MKEYIAPTNRIVTIDTEHLLCDSKETLGYSNTTTASHTDCEDGEVMVKVQSLWDEPW